MWIFSLALMIFLLIFVPITPQPIIPSRLPELVPLNTTNASSGEQLNILGYGSIKDIAWAPDGKTVAAATTTGVIIYNAILFDRDSYYRIHVPEPTPASVAFSPDGKLLAIVSRPNGDTWAEINAQEKVIDIWDFQRKAIVAEWKSMIDFPNVVFSPDGASIVLYSDNLAQEWDILKLDDIRYIGEKSWKILQQQWYLPVLTQINEIDTANIFAFAPNGKYIAELTQDDNIRIWDVLSKKLLHTIPYRSTNLIFSSDGELAAFTDETEGYEKLRIWSIQDNVALYEGDPPALNGWEFNPTKPQLLYSTAVSNIWLWDEQVKEPQVVLGYDERWWRNNVYGVSFNPHNSELAVARMYQVEIWDSLTGIKLRATNANEDGKYLTSIAYSPDGKRLATASQDGYVRLWDSKTLEPLGVIEHFGEAHDAVFSPDGMLLATYGDTDENDQNTAPSAVYLWRVSDLLVKGKVLQSKQALAKIYNINLSNKIFNIRFSPDSKTIAVTGKGIEFWDVETVVNRNPNAKKDSDESGLINLIENGTGPIAWSPDGEKIAVGKGNNPDCSFTIFNANDGSPWACMKGHAGLVTALAFDPTDDVIASTSSSHNIQEMDTDNTVRIWDTETGTQLNLLNKHYEDVLSIAFNADGTLIASGSGGCYHCGAEGYSIDGTVRLWGVPKSGQ
jgi:WD40 repeat protein